MGWVQAVCRHKEEDRRAQVSESPDTPAPGSGKPGDAPASRPTLLSTCCLCHPQGRSPDVSCTTSAWMDHTRRGSLFGVTRLGIGFFLSRWIQEPIP